MCLSLSARAVLGKEVSDRALPRHPEVCQDLLPRCVGSAGPSPCPSPILMHFLGRQKTMGFWFQGVREPHIHQALPGPSLLCSLLISSCGAPGEIATVKGPLVKVKVTPRDTAAVHPSGSGAGPGDGAKGCAGWRVEMPSLALKPSLTSSSLCSLSPRCLSFPLGHIGRTTVHFCRVAWTDAIRPSPNCFRGRV